MHGGQRALIALLATTAALTACTGDGDGDGNENAGPRDGGASSEALRPAWDEATPGLSPAMQGYWLSDDRLVMLGDEGLFGYDAATGERLWQLEVPAGVLGMCGLAAPNEDGIGGVLLTVEDGCLAVGAVDEDDGELLWWHDPSSDAPFVDPATSVSVGESVLTLNLACGDVHRYAVDDGERLPTMQSWDDRCAHEVAHNGELVAIRNEPEDADTPVEGWIPPSPGSAAFAVFDSETGEELWRQEVERQDTELHRIIATEPLTLETTVRGDRFIRTFDEDGEEVHLIGEELSGDDSLDNGNEWLSTQGSVTDGVLVTGFADDPLLYAYDLETGEELWTMPKSEAEVIGARDGVLLASVTEDGQPERRLLTLDARTGDRTDLGLIPPLRDGDPGSATIVIPIAWDDQNVYVLHTVTGGDTRLAAYHLPDGGPLP